MAESPTQASDRGGGGAHHEGAENLKAQRPGGGGDAAAVEPLRALADRHQVAHREPHRPRILRTGPERQVGPHQKSRGVVVGVSAWVFGILRGFGRRVFRMQGAAWDWVGHQSSSCFLQCMG